MPASGEKPPPKRVSHFLASPLTPARERPVIGGGKDLSMLGDLFQLLASALRRKVRHMAVTVILLFAGGVLTALALGMGFWALYLWLQLELGTFAALGILGGAFALTGVTLFAVAFRRGGNNERVTRDIVPVELAETRARARKRVRRNSRESTLLTILIALVIGWIVGRRTRR
jgi:hypothetical protein